jgi:hypothetical protein
MSGIACGWLGPYDTGGKWYESERGWNGLWVCCYYTFASFR